MSKSIPFPAFFADYYLKHMRVYKKHRFLFIIISKNHVGRDKLGISEEEIWSTRDFGQTQQEYSTGSTLSPLRVWLSSF